MPASSQILAALSIAALGITPAKAV
ncbi:MAG: hypothetical protein RIS92_277, partial [Verrucomicrobiota bacterium]